MPVEDRPLQEAELVARARDGDVSAYEGLVRMHQGIALRVAYFVTGDHVEAEEAVQEAMVKAYRNLSRFREEAPFRPWLLQIVRNEARNRRRWRGRQDRLALRAANEAVSGGAVPSPESVVMDREQAESVLSALDRLPGSFRDVLGARYLLGLSEEETAAMLGVPRGTVKSRTSRALEKLREVMGDRDV